MKDLNLILPSKRFEIAFREQIENDAGIYARELEKALYGPDLIQDINFLRTSCNLPTEPEIKGLNSWLSK